MPRVSVPNLNLAAANGYTTTVTSTNVMQNMQDTLRDNDEGNKMRPDDSQIDL